MSDLGILTVFLVKSQGGIERFNCKSCDIEWQVATCYIR